MRIIFNGKLLSDINELLDDPSVAFAIQYWGKTESFERSAIDLQIFQTDFGSISLLYGPRQVGKTASLKQFLYKLQDSDTLAFTDCSTILDKSDLAKHITELIKNKTTIVLDEVQSVKEWHLALRSLYGEGLLKKCRIWCTGSEARYLIESGERLPGRKGSGKTLFARPWSFREYMDVFYPAFCKPVKELNIKHITSEWLREQQFKWEKPWSEYCRTGGFIRAIAELHVDGEISDDTFRIYKDWIMGNWSIIRTPERSLKSLLARLNVTMNSRVSYESLKNGTDIHSPNTVKSLLDIQQDHFVIKLIPRFDLQSKKFLQTKMKKIFPIDPLIARVFTSIEKDIRRQIDLSLPHIHLDECAFAAQTSRYEPKEELSYLYSEKSKSEIDFYFQNIGFELKSNGKPTEKQQKLLNQCPIAFTVNKNLMPLVSYLIGESRF